MADDQRPADDVEQPDDDASGALSQEEVEALLAGTGEGAAQEPAEEVGGTLRQDAIEPRLASSDDAPSPADDAAQAEGTVSQDEIEALLAGEGAGPEPAASQEEASPLLDDAVLDRLLGEPQGGGTQAQGGEPPGETDDEDLFGDKKKTRFGTAGQSAAAPTPIREGRSESVRDLDLLAEVVLTVSAEIGRSEMTIEDVLKLGPGSLIELNKLAGEPVELLVNDRCIARGEVVVVDDSFGVRITELGE